MADLTRQKSITLDLEVNIKQPNVIFQKLESGCNNYIDRSEPLYKVLLPIIFSDKEDILKWAKEMNKLHGGLQVVAFIKDALNIGLREAKGVYDREIL